jgi:hypothetical protein
VVGVATGDCVVAAGVGDWGGVALGGGGAM